MARLQAALVQSESSGWKMDICAVTCSGGMSRVWQENGVGRGKGSV